MNQVNTRRPRPTKAARQAEIAKRQESARKEQPHIELLRGDPFYGWYEVSGSRGSVYEVQVALEARRRASCTCYDFATNGIDTCKHIEAVRLWLAATPEAAAWRDALTVCQGDINDLDIVVFDLETQRLFQDVGGRKAVARLGLSVGVVYGLRDSSYSTYWEADAEALIHRLCSADLVVGFNLLNFDYPVLEAYNGYSLYRIPTLDMMLHIGDELGFWLGLDALASATLGVGKTADGLMAVEWYRSGQLDLLAQYCRSDVEVTTGVFLHGREKGVLQFVGRDNRMHSVKAGWQAVTQQAVG